MNATQIDINALCAWGIPKKVNTANGPRILRTAAPSESFRKLFGSSKSPGPAMAELKSAGLGWSKDNQTGEWIVAWWQPDTETTAKQEAAVEASKATDANIEIPAPEGCAYLPYQKAGIAWGMSHPNCLIADEPGLGKTIEAAGIINADASLKKILIVCPASLKLNWQRELEKWLVTPRSIGIAKGTDFPATEIVIINYDIASKHREKLHGTAWDLVILDESHYLKNPKAARTKAILGDYKTKQPALVARRKMGLTGTPILNRPIEAQPMLGWLCPEKFGNFFKFAKNWCDAKQVWAGRNAGMVWDFTGASNLERFQMELRTSCMIRRMKKDVLTELPAKRRQVIELATNGASKIVAAEQTALEKHNETLQTLRDAVALAKVLENKEDYEKAVEALRAGQSAAFAEMSKIRHEVALAKVPYVVEHVTDACEAGPVVLFAHHRDVVEGLVSGLTETGKKCVSLVGGMSGEDKQAAVDKFQAGEADVFVGNIHAAGVGITLTRSSHVVFAELDWVPANMSQAEDRTHRIGQKAAVFVQHLVLEGSLDQVMAKALVDKQEIADAALDDPMAKLEMQEPVETITVKVARSIDPTAKSVSTDKPTKIYTPEEIEKFHAGLKYLAGVCDGAVSLDGAGFNKLDAEFGRKLASLTTLTPRQTAVAERLCRKYRRQLGNL